jgi:putative two-component system response regulator
MAHTVLVVDDEEANRELMQYQLNDAGFHVVTAPNGQAGLLEFGRCQPHVVLLDVQMPRMDGFEVCRRLKANPDTRLVPVVLVTGLSATRDRILGIQAGADDFLTKPVDTNELVARVRSLVNLKEFTDELERAESVLFALALSIEGKDPYTQGHCQRLADLSARLGETIGLNAEEITALRRAGIVHDVGKVAVPDAILLKPAKLTDAEFKLVQQHPMIGEKICSPLKSFRLVLPIIRHHHEKLNGSGYPDGLRNGEVPTMARVLQIVDVYDALTTERPYKHAMGTSEALDTMRDEVSRGWWDPDIFASFSSMIRTTVGVCA